MILRKSQSASQAIFINFSTSSLTSPICSILKWWIIRVSSPGIGTIKQKLSCQARRNKYHMDKIPAL